VFDALHRRHKEIDGEDLQPRPLSERNAKLLAPLNRPRPVQVVA
jgi:hypothetical protein